MRHRRRLTAITICVLAGQVLVIAGCGAGEQTTGPAKMSKAQFLRAANHVCEQATANKEQLQAEKVESLLKRTNSSPSHADLVNLGAEVARPYREAVAELAALADRVGDARVDKLISEYELAVKASERNPALLIRNNPFVPPSEHANKFGLTKCTF